MPVELSFAGDSLDDAQVGVNVLIGKELKGAYLGFALLIFCSMIVLFVPPILACILNGN